jgi:pimeloyl-[acyl-carrier protein] methyl ester esterase
MTLYYEAQGQGPTLVLVHGWGLHGGVWADLAARLADDFRVVRVDLPGHGRSAPGSGPLGLPAIADQVLEIVTTPAIWLGWSLGALVALEVARRAPAAVTRLVLVGATPRFVQAPDWASGMAAEVFTQFAAGLAQDYRGTLLRFLSLQAGGDQEARALLKRLRAELFAHGEPHPAALAAGLDILAHTDLRTALAQIRVPALIVHGSHDRLAPPAAGEFLARHIDGARYALLAGAGHAPFLSQPQDFADTLRGFLA